MKKMMAMSYDAEKNADTPIFSKAIVELTTKDNRNFMDPGFVHRLMVESGDEYIKKYAPDEASHGTIDADDQPRLRWDAGFANNEVVQSGGRFGSHLLQIW